MQWFLLSLLVKLWNQIPHKILWNKYTETKQNIWWIDLIFPWHTIMNPIAILLPLFRCVYWTWNWSRGLHIPYLIQIPHLITLMIWILLLQWWALIMNVWAETYVDIFCTELSAFTNTSLTSDLHKCKNPEDLHECGNLDFSGQTLPGISSHRPQTPHGTQRWNINLLNPACWTYSRLHLAGEPELHSF